MNSIITEPNPYTRAYQNDLSIFDHILHDPALMVDPEHIIGKLTKEIHLKDYHITEVKEITDKMLNVWDYNKKKHIKSKIYSFGLEGYKSLISEKFIKEIAIDAKLSGLISKGTIDHLLTCAHIMTSERPNRPVIFKLGSTCYFIAPAVFD